MNKFREELAVSMAMLEFLEWVIENKEETLKRWLKEAAENEGILDIEIDEDLLDVTRAGLIFHEGIRNFLQHVEELVRGEMKGTAGKSGEDANSGDSVAKGSDAAIAPARGVETAEKREQNAESEITLDKDTLLKEIEELTERLISMLGEESIKASVAGLTSIKRGDLGVGGDDKITPERFGTTEERLKEFLESWKPKPDEPES